MPQTSKGPAKPNDPGAVIAITLDDTSLSKLSDEQRNTLKKAGGDLSKVSGDMRKSINATLNAAAGHELLDAAAHIFGPPIVLLLFGMLLYWSLKGFDRGHA